MTNFEWLKQNDELLYKALECDECPGCAFSEIEGGCSVLTRKEWLNKEHENFKVGDIIVSKRSRLIYVCTHIEDDAIYYDSSLKTIENPKVNYGVKACQADFELYKGWEND